MTAHQGHPQPAPATHALLARVKRATPQALGKTLGEADWAQVPLPVLAWASSRKGVSLKDALHGFFNADPMRFNYMRKSEVPAEFRAMCRVLDAMCLRINSSFFDNVKAVDDDKLPDGFDNWITCQKLDLLAGKSGRWVIREAVLMTPVSRSKKLPFAELTSPVPSRLNLCSDWRAELRDIAKQRFQGLKSRDLNQA